MDNSKNIFTSGHVLLEDVFWGVCSYKETFIRGFGIEVTAYCLGQVSPLSFSVGSHEKPKTQYGAREYHLGRSFQRKQRPLALGLATQIQFNC